MPLTQYCRNIGNRLYLNHKQQSTVEQVLSCCNPDVLYCQQYLLRCTQSMKPCYIIILILLLSCQQKGQLTPKGSGNNLVSHNQERQAETFWSFHHRFLTDTGFQKSRRLDTSKA